MSLAVWDHTVLPATRHKRYIISTATVAIERFTQSARNQEFSFVRLVAHRMWDAAEPQRLQHVCVLCRVLVKALSVAVHQLIKRLQLQCTQVNTASDCIKLNHATIREQILFRHRKQWMKSSAIHSALAVSDNISQKSIFMDNNQMVIPENNHHHRLQAYY